MREHPCGHQVEVYVKGSVMLPLPCATCWGDGPQLKLHGYIYHRQRVHSLAHGTGHRWVVQSMPHPHAEA